MTPDEQARLQLAVDCFVHAVEDALAHHENKDKDGMTVPFFGDFANAPPSVLSRLRWHMRNLKGVL